MTSRCLAVAAVSILALCPVVSLAQPAASGSDPTAPIKQLDDALLRAMKQGSAGFSARARTIAPVVDSAFDLEGILRTIVGPRWATIPPAQQQHLLAAFRTFTVANYAANFTSYGGQTIKVVPPVRSIGDEDVVSTSIADPGGSPNTIAYVLKQVNGGWKIEDVLLNGTISNIAVQRSDFQSVLSSGGAEKLVSNLDAHATALANGTTQ